MPERFRKEPQHIEAGICQHGNKEATCPECLKDAEAVAESLKKARKPAGRHEPKKE